MKITSSIEYATRLMVTLARADGRATMAAERLAEADGIPSVYVAQLLVKLRRAGLIESRRGVAGGYALARRPGEITLAQIVRAVDGVVFEDVCGKYDSDGDKDCHHQGACAISPVWARLGALINEYFESVTLASILEGKAAECGSSAAWVEKLAGRS